MRGNGSRGSGSAVLARRTSVAVAVGGGTTVVVAAVAPTEVVPVAAVAGVAVVAVVSAVVLHRPVVAAAISRGRGRWLLDAYPLAMLVALLVLGRSPDRRAGATVVALCVLLVASLVARPVVIGTCVVALGALVVAGSATGAGGDVPASVGLVVAGGVVAWIGWTVRRAWSSSRTAHLATLATAERFAAAVEVLSGAATGAGAERGVRAAGAADDPAVVAIGDVARRLGWETCTLHLVDAAARAVPGAFDRGDVAPVPARPRGVIAEALERGAPAVRAGGGRPGHDDDGHRHLGVVVAVPVHAAGDTLGVLVVGRSEGSVAPTDVRLLELAATQVGHGLGAARAFVIQRRSVEQARAAEVARDDFIATVSHELRTPVQVLMGMSETLDTRWHALDEHQRRDFVSRMRRHGLDLTGLVDALLSTARLEAEEPPETVPVDAAALAQVAVERLRAVERHHEIGVASPAPGTAIVDGDPLLLDRAIENVLLNACRHTPPGTHVVLRVERLGGEVRLVVGDDGPGIAAADLPHVTEQFHRGGEGHLRRGARGLGLGLHLTNTIVEAHGGALEIESREGVGTIVTIRLPLRHAEPSVIDLGDPTSRVWTSSTGAGSRSGP